MIVHAFLAALDLDYQAIYTCERCTAEDMKAVTDGKEMGIRHTHSKSYQRPLAEGAAEFATEWCAYFHALTQSCLIIGAAGA